jgi:hypothetical protein
MQGVAGGVSAAGTLGEEGIQMERKAAWERTREGAAVWRGERGGRGVAEGGVERSLGRSIVGDGRLHLMRVVSRGRRVVSRGRGLVSTGRVEAEERPSN